MCMYISITIHAIIRISVHWMHSSLFVYKSQTSSYVFSYPSIVVKCRA